MLGKPFGYSKGKAIGFHKFYADLVSLHLAGCRDGPSTRYPISSTKDSGPDMER